MVNKMYSIAKKLGVILLVAVPLLCIAIFNTGTPREASAASDPTSCYDQCRNWDVVVIDGVFVTYCKTWKRRATQECRDTWSHP